MRMFLSFSGHSSELSIANHSSQPTVSQLKWISDTISNWFENHQLQKTKISTVTNTFFIQWPLGWLQPRVFKGIFQLLQYSRQRPRFSAHRAALMTKTYLTFHGFSLRFVDFVVQFCFRCEFSFHEELRTSQVWQWSDFFLTNHNSFRLLCKETNEVASFSRDNRLRQLTVFRVCQSGKRLAFASRWKIFN